MQATEMVPTVEMMLTARVTQSSGVIQLLLDGCDRTVR
jgi:hypothetical protein